jgi:NADH dehydrogenase [ubiquinone] 1 alpha subcomplex assembly factor 1
MKMMAIVAALLFAATPFSGFDFSDSSVFDQWRVINDGVMGGMSTSKSIQGEGSLIFKGDLSLENNGGFASIRAPWDSYDLSEFKEVVIECKGNGGKFMCMLEKERMWYRPYYTAQFEPTEERTTFTIKLKDFKENEVGRQNGKRLSKKTLPLIKRIGFIKNDKKEGPFELEVYSVKFQ